MLLALSERIAAQDAQIARLTARMEELERRLNRSSRNSSLPPSQDPPGMSKRQRPHGSQSDQGERSIERLLSTSITCRLHRRSLHDYLTHVITAHTRGHPIPTLT